MTVAGIYDELELNKEILEKIKSFRIGGGITMKKRLYRLYLLGSCNLYIKNAITIVQEQLNADHNNLLGSELGTYEGADEY